MPRIALLALAAYSIATLSAAPVVAQEAGTTVTLTVSPSFVNFDGFGGGFGAIVMRLSVSRDFTRTVGGEISAFSLAPIGGASAQPGCAIGATCQTRTTPSLLYGVLPSIFTWVGGSDLRLSGGLGMVGASGGEGLGSRQKAAGVLGIDWVPRSGNRFAPTFAFRVVQLSSPIAGARQLLLPGVGLSF